MGSEGSWRPKPDSTNRNQIEGRGLGVSEPWIATPNNDSDKTLVNLARPRIVNTELSMDNGRSEVSHERQETSEFQSRVQG